MSARRPVRVSPSPSVKPHPSNTAKHSHPAALLCVLLLVVWLVGLTWRKGVIMGQRGIIFRGGSFVAWYNRDMVGDFQILPDIPPHSLRGWRYVAGQFSYSWYPGYSAFSLPLPPLLTLLLPLALGPFHRFRFPLWSYFAYTALLAAELAYYLKA